MLDKKIVIKGKKDNNIMTSDTMTRLTLSIDKSVIDKLKAISKNNQRSMSGQVTHWILKGDKNE